MSHSLTAFMLLITFVQAEYSISDTPAAATANYCAQGCAEYAYGWNMVMFSCNLNRVATCLCDTENGHSSSMDVSISMCPTSSGCGGAADATQGLLMFSEYCSMNLIGTTLPTITQGNAASAASTGMVITPPATQTGSTSPTSSTSSSSTNSNSLSTSDKIAIACAVGGALVTIAVAVPTWLHMRNKKRKENAVEAEPLHGMPQYMPSMYSNPAQQPFFVKPQPQVYYYPQQNRWGWSSWFW